MCSRKEPPESHDKYIKLLTSIGFRKYLLQLFDSRVFSRVPKYSELMSKMFASRSMTPRRYSVMSLSLDADQYACEAVHQVRALQNGVWRCGVDRERLNWLLAVVLWPAKAEIPHVPSWLTASSIRQSYVILIYLRMQHHRKSVTVMECNVMNINSDIIRMFYT